MAKSADKDPTEKTGTPTLQTVDRAFSFLEYVAKSDTAPTVQDVSEALKLNITTCYHLMRTLVKRDYLKRLSGGRLAVGNAIGPLYRAYRLRLNVNHEVTDIIRRLSEKTGETTFFSAPEGEVIVLKALVEGFHQLRVGGLFVGSTGKEHLRASGRAILPYLDEAHREKILARSLSGLTKKDAVVARRKFDEAMVETLERGWSSDAGNTEIGISSIGFPIFDGRGRIYGSIGVVGPTLRFGPSRDAWVAATSDAADEANAFLKNALTA